MSKRVKTSYPGVFHREAQRVGAREPNGYIILFSKKRVRYMTRRRTVNMLTYDTCQGLPVSEQKELKEKDNPEKNKRKGRGKTGFRICCYSDIIPNE